MFAGLVKLTLILRVKTDRIQDAVEHLQKQSQGLVSLGAFIVEGSSDAPHQTHVGQANHAQGQRDVQGLVQIEAEVEHLALLDREVLGGLAFDVDVETHSELADIVYQQPMHALFRNHHEERKG